MRTLSKEPAELGGLSGLESDVSYSRGARTGSGNSEREPTLAASEARVFLCFLMLTTAGGRNLCSCLGQGTREEQPLPVPSVPMAVGIC